MNPDSPVTLRKLTYRGVADYHLSWEEDGAPREASFDNEAEAVVEMATIEERIRIKAIEGKGLTVNPFGAAVPFITSKDVYFASMRLQPRGIGFREAITDHVAALTALQGVGVGVAEAAHEYAKAHGVLKPFEVSLEQAIFEWAELKKQVGDKPLFEILRTYLKQAGVGAGAGATPPPGASPGRPSSPSM